MHVTIPLREVIKVPSIKEIFENYFKGSDGPMDPPIMLQDDQFRVQYDDHPPFFMTLLMNNDADLPSLLRATRPPGLGSIKKLSRFDSLGLC